MAEIFLKIKKKNKNEKMKEIYRKMSLKKINKKGIVTKEKWRYKIFSFYHVQYKK